MDDELEASHWGDVVTSSTLNNYNDILNENGFQSDRDDTDSYQEQDPFQEQSIQDKDDTSINDNGEQILSSLTNGLEPEHLSETVISKDENLFNNIDVGPIEVDETVEISPVKQRGTRIMYKPPRFRRSAVKTKLDKSSEVKQEDLGPLGLINEDDDDIDVNGLKSPLKRDKLINSIEKPLFDIASTKTKLPSSMSSNKSVPRQDLDVKFVKPEYSFDITVSDPHKIGSELLNAHIQYTVTTKSDFPLLKDVPEISVERRYNDFLWLYNQLIHSHHGVIIPPPPEKQVVGRFKKNFIEYRRLSLEKMLLNISQNFDLQKDQDFIIFLTSDKFNDEAKYREHSFELDDDSSLISSITGAFSSQPKYVEQDQFFVDQQLYIDQLEINLKNLYKSMELIANTRSDLTVSIEEFNKYLLKLSDLEINNEISLIFNNYNQLITKIQDNVERFSMSEMLTIGNTIDEYLRSIQSVNVIFGQRLKLMSSLYLNELNLSKKQKNFAKFKLKFHNQLDKVQKYESEIETLQKTIDEETQLRDVLISTIKDELSRFNYSRLTNFQNSFEIYWESLIESQKELIELWETFYDSCKF